MAESLNLNGTWGLWWNDGQRGEPMHRLHDPKADTSNALAAEVPGEIHLDLLRAGLIEEPGTSASSIVRTNDQTW